MQPKQEKVILIIADISGYTRFMVANNKTLDRSQLIIMHLIQTMIEYMEMPLEISKIEGDAVFLFAITDSNEQLWEKKLKLIGEKLEKFCQVFNDKVEELRTSVLCKDGVCQFIEKLKLKIVVHSGSAYFHKIGSFQELCGMDVIIVHRLLKNNINSSEYILMTEAAYKDLQLENKIAVNEGLMYFEGVGTLNTFVYYSLSNR